MGETKRALRRNVTITLPDDVARWARIEAAKRDTSVSQLVAGMLQEKMRDDDAYDAAMKRMFAMIRPVKFEEPGGRFPRREDLYDRPKRRS
jgi:hypothetical protein